MDFTMIGDGVNLASRLESACKQYSARILISEHTLGQLKGVYRTREVDYVVVKGKTEPVAVYEVLDYHTPQTFPNLMDAVNHFRDGIEKYRGGNWESAVDAFRETLRANPDDTLAETYIDRCLRSEGESPGRLERHLVDDLQVADGRFPAGYHGQQDGRSGHRPTT